MKERPILFSGEMVRAILDGRKTMTRRVVKPQPPHSCVYEINGNQNKACCYVPNDNPERILWVPPTAKSKNHLLPCPFGGPGDRLWVRETWGQSCDKDSCGVVCYAADRTAYHILCDCDGEGDAVGHGWKHYAPLTAWEHIRWRPSIHMPRWASRLTLEITGVRVERLQEITEEDAAAEGFIKLPATGRAVLNKGAQYFGNNWPSARAGFRDLWDQLNAKRGFDWDQNPWVWVLGFKRVEDRQP